MALGLTQNASNAIQYCLPCCKQLVFSCCENDLAVNEIETLNIHFFDMVCTVNPILNIFIKPFTVPLKRLSQIPGGRHWANPSVLPSNYTRWTSGAFFYDPAIYGFVYPPVYYAAALRERLTPIDVTINASSYVQNGIEDSMPNYGNNIKIRYTPALINETQYYADVPFANCASGNFEIGLRIYRDLIQGLDIHETNQIQDFYLVAPLVGGGVYQPTYSGSVYNCSPYLAYQSAHNMYSFGHSVVWEGYPAYNFAYFNADTLDENNNVIAQGTLHYSPYLSFKWIITE